jgi:hypothetical protein
VSEAGSVMFKSSRPTLAYVRSEAAESFVAHVPDEGYV